MGDMTKSTNKWSNLIRYAGQFAPELITRASGTYIYDQNGRALLDFTSGQMCAVVGHNHPALVAAIEQACKSVIHLHVSHLSPPVVELASEITQLLPRSLSKVMLLSTGSEANEAAIRMAKLATGGFEVYALSGSWHGMTAGSNSSTYAFNRQSFGPLMPGVQMIPMPSCYRCPVKRCHEACDLACLEIGFELTDRQAVGQPAAFLVEPLLSAGGVVELPEGYLSRLRELCDERGLLLIADEAQTALGRLGHMFGFEQEPGFVPDFLTMSKTLGGGVPLSAVVTSQEIEEKCHERGFIFPTSHVSDPLPANVGLALVRLIVRERLVERARDMGMYFKNQLHELRSRHECLGDVRGKGLLLGLDIVADRATRQPDADLGARIMDNCFDKGLSVNIVSIPRSVGGVFRIAPPLTVSREEIDLAMEILDAAITECVENCARPLARVERA